ncbi:hypothetical protein O181_023734 [Austropuccinia psidii MF-1]|uniref:sn-1-specific diacylglycerol lipase n=1 Tax=Austropuccinia psidii MF-1 TaxID=1389203 RepID=A0A9Q3CEZ2_9BASI|nr:hypothetical protein [Austropuccinia psidii MF-1]
MIIKTLSEWLSHLNFLNQNSKSKDYSKANSQEISQEISKEISQEISSESEQDKILQKENLEEFLQIDQVLNSWTGRLSPIASDNLISRLENTPPLLPYKIANLITASSLLTRISLRSTSLLIKILIESLTYSTNASLGITRRALISAISTANQLHSNSIYQFNPLKLNHHHLNHQSNHSHLQNLQNHQNHLLHPTNLHSNHHQILNHSNLLNPSSYHDHLDLIESNHLNSHYSNLLNHYTNQAIYLIHHTFTITELISIAGLNLTHSIISTCFQAAEGSVMLFDSIFGSNESSRALSAIIILIRRELLHDPAFTPNHHGTLIGLMALIKAIIAFACLQLATSRRTMASMKMRVIWDATVITQDHLESKTNLNLNLSSSIQSHPQHHQPLNQPQHHQPLNQPQHHPSSSSFDDPFKSSSTNHSNLHSQAFNLKSPLSTLSDSHSINPSLNLLHPSTFQLSSSPSTSPINSLQSNHSFNSHPHPHHPPPPPHFIPKLSPIKSINNSTSSSSLDSNQPISPLNLIPNQSSYNLNPSQPINQSINPFFINSISTLEPHPQHQPLPNTSSSSTTSSSNLETHHPAKFGLIRRKTTQRLTRMETLSEMSEPIKTNHHHHHHHATNHHSNESFHSHISSSHHINPLQDFSSSFFPKITKSRSQSYSLPSSPQFSSYPLPYSTITSKHTLTRSKTQSDLYSIYSDSYSWESLPLESSPITSSSSSQKLNLKSENFKINPLQSQFKSPINQSKVLDTINSTTSSSLKTQINDSHSSSFTSSSLSPRHIRHRQHSSTSIQTSQSHHVCHATTSSSSFGIPPPPLDFPSASLVQNLGKFMRYSSAAYGQKFLRIMGIGVDSFNYPNTKKHSANDHAFASHVGLTVDQIVLSSFTEPHPRLGNDALSPLVHYVSIDHQIKAVVLTCRGTLGLSDILVDLTCEYEPISVEGGDPNASYLAHSGMLHSALCLRRESSTVHEVIKQTLLDYPDYGLIITGHSLGGGVAALLAVLCSTPAQSFLNQLSHQSLSIHHPPIITKFVTSFRSGFPPGRPIHSFTYGTPAVASIDLCHYTKGLVTTVCNGIDIVPTLSLGVLHDFKNIAVSLHQEESVALEIVKKVIGLYKPNQSNSHSNLNHQFSHQNQKSNQDVKLKDEEIKAGFGKNRANGHDYQDPALKGSKFDRAENSPELGDWLWSLMRTMRAVSDAEKLYPPDQLKIQTGRHSVKEIKKNQSGCNTSSTFTQTRKAGRRIILRYCEDVQARFSEPIFGKSMFHDHIPSQYELAFELLEGATTTIDDDT